MRRRCRRRAIRKRVSYDFYGDHVHTWRHRFYPYCRLQNNQLEHFKAKAMNILEGEREYKKLTSLSTDAF